MKGSVDVGSNSSGEIFSRILDPTSLYNLLRSISIITVFKRALSQEQNTQMDDEEENSGFG